MLAKTPYPTILVVVPYAACKWNKVFDAQDLQRTERGQLLTHAVLCRCPYRSTARGRYAC